MKSDAIQDRYSQATSHCYGCGYSNEAGLHLKSHWDGTVATATFVPAPQYTAFPGYVYGGLIASLIDCHGIATAAAAFRAAGEDPASDELPRFVTASLKVDFRAPTPTGIELSLAAEPREIGARKVVVAVEVRAADELCASGEVIAVLMPQKMVDRIRDGA